MEGKLIPKRMFFYWGNKTLSWMRYLTLYSFRKFNPDWEIILFLTDVEYEKERPWKDGPVQDFHNYAGKDYLRKILDLDITIKHYHFSDEEKEAGPSYRSNFFKWRMLSDYSGFYSDLDILYVRPFESFYDKVKESDVVICHNEKYFSIGLLGSSGENKFYKDVYESSLTNYNSNYYQSAGALSLLSLIHQITGNTEIHLLNIKDGISILEKEYPNLSFYNIPMDLVYPWTSTKMVDVFEKKHTSLPEECVGIHWYAGDLLAQEYNNILTEENYQNFDNTFCYFVNKISAI